jgi:polysaccharide biosynthesis transport protein
MELKNYFRLLKRHWFMLVSIPVIAMIGAWFFVRLLPDKYVAKTQIITGLVDQSKQVMGSSNFDTQGKRNDEFTNLIETMQLDRVLSQVSYRLLIHDLVADKPFRRLKVDEKGYSRDWDKPIVNLLQQKQQHFELLNPSVPFENRVDSVIGALGYDGSTLLKKNLKIFHSEGSDFINIECETENPALSAFIINTLSGRFISYYTRNLSSGRNKSTAFLAGLLNEKKTAMRNKIAELQQYKIKHNILDMADEAKGVYGQISSLESNSNAANKDVIAYSGALKSIDSRFNPKDRRYLESATTRANGKILDVHERLRVLNEKYVESNFDQRYKKAADSLRNILSEQINESNDKYITNPLATKDNLVQEKLKMENQLELARYGSQSLNRQISSLQGRLNALVPAQAVVNSLERDIDVTTKEYLDVQDKFNQANVANILPVQLAQLHPALPGTRQPSKKLLLVGLSGFASLALCLTIMLLLFYVDDSVRNGADLERLTQIKVLGELNFVPDVSGKPLKASQERLVNATIQIFRNLLRNIRFEIDRMLENDKIISITSLNGTQGKTLFAFSLAYAYAIANKKVLLIDGNFTNPNITEAAQPDVFLEDLLHDNELVTDNATPALHEGKPVLLLESDYKTNLGATLNRLSNPAGHVSAGAERVTIVGNRGGDHSLLEISSRQSIQYKMDALRNQFDIIIIETGSLDTLSKAKEWIPFTDKVVGVFENNQSIKESAKASIQYLRNLNGKMMGWVINKVEVKHKELVAAS